jgi:hypothetical protein
MRKLLVFEVLAVIMLATCAVAVWYWYITVGY